MSLREKIKKMTAVLISGAAAVSMMGGISFSSTSAEAGEMRDISTMELVRDMGIGINLGNTFDACGDWIAEYSDSSVKAYETAWGSPVITQKMIQGYASEGFGVLRIPTAWSNRMVQDGNYKIDKEWMARITQIVDWTLETGMYAIVNIHWDNGWVNTFPENKTECMKRFTVMWEQISENFKNYGDHLMFESQNEELGWESMYNRWNPQFNDKEGSYNLANEINQKFVDVIRKSGGNNPKRHLLISGYNTGFDTTCDPLFKMPDDPAGRCAVSVHYYTPAGFAILEEDADWGKATSTWGTQAEINELKTNMDMMKTNFIDKGIPVIVGEYGCPKKNKDPESVRLFLKTVCQEAYSRKLCPVLWDTPGNEESEPHYSRQTCKMTDQELKAAFNAIAKFDYVPSETEPTQSSTEPTATEATTTKETTTKATTKETTTTKTTGTTDKPSLPEPADPGSNTEMRDMKTMELVRDMGLGINIGNTFDACGDWIAEYSDGSVKAYETAWGSPVITQKMIQGYASEGFGVLRIPVAWSNRMVQDGNYKIDKEWMARITQIVDWTLDAGMYAIVNIHWDNGWVNTFPENKTECMKRFTAMWEQISENFKNYGDHLMFESQNEELGWESMYNRWNPQFNDKEGSYNLANEINQKFVDVIRKSGGNNPKRHLLISGYNTGFDTTCDPLFKMPSDPAGRCAVSVHYYTPAGFAILEEDADWGKATSTWGTSAEIDELETNMEMMKTNFIDKGIPVIVGEYGCPKKNKDPESVRLFLKTVCKAAYSRQLCPILWDTPGNEESEPHYDRKTCAMSDPELKAAFNEIAPPKTPEATKPTESTKPDESNESTKPDDTSEPDETTKPGTAVKGDVNGDGSVNVFDSVTLKRYVCEIPCKIVVEAADLDNNGSVNVADVVYLNHYLVNPKKYPLK